MNGISSTADEQGAISRLQALCQIPSVTGAEAEIARAVDWIRDTYGAGSEFIDVMRDETDAIAGMLIAFGPPARDRLTFYNYLDVTPPGDESHWTNPPFSAHLDGGRLYARGAVSNKGDLIARLEAVSQLHTEGKLDREVVFLIDAAEEHGSPKFGEMMARWEDHLAARLLIWNTGFVNRSGEPIVGCGFKGILLARLTARIEPDPGHSGVGGGPNAIHQLLDAIAPILAEDGLRDLLPDYPARDAVEESIGAVHDSAIAEELGERAGMLPAAARKDERSRFMRRALLEPTANVPWIQGGQPNELTRYADLAECVLECRLVPPQRAAPALAAIAEFCATEAIGCVPLIQQDAYAVEASARDEMLDRLVPPLEECFGAGAHAIPIVPFSARAREVSETLGAAVVSVGITDAGSAPHGVDESVSCDLFLAAGAFVRRLVAPGA